MLMNETTIINLADQATTHDLQAICLAWQDAGLSGTPLGTRWEDFLDQTAAQSQFDLAVLEALFDATCQAQAPSPGVCALLLEALRLAPAVRAHIPEGVWLAQAQTLALDFLQAGRYNADSRRVLWDMAFSGLSHQIRPLYAAPDLDRLAAVLHAYPFVLEDAYLVPSLLSPLIDVWADRPKLLEGLRTAYGHFPATAKKLNRLTGK